MPDTRRRLRDAIATAYHVTNQDVVVKVGGQVIADAWSAIESVTINRGRDTPTDGPRAGTATITWLADRVRPSAFTAGEQVSIEFDEFLAALIIKNLFPPGTRNNPYARFSGHLTDLGDVELRDPARTAPTFPTIASTLYARLSAVPIGLAPMVGVRDVDVVQLVVLAAWANDPGVRLSWFTDGYGPTHSLDIRQPSPAFFARWDVDSQTPDQIFGDLIASTEAEIIEARDCSLDMIKPVDRRSAEVWLTLDASQVRAPVTVKQSTEGLANSVTVNYGPSDAQASVLVEDAASIARFGRRPATLSTRLANRSDALDLGSDYVGRNAYPRWRLDQITIDVLALMEAGDLAAVSRLYWLDQGQLIELDGLPDYAPLTSGRYWVLNVTETFTSSSWLITVGLAEYADLAPAVAWAELPADLTWDELPADLTWSGATGWLPPVSSGAWRLLPTNLRWRDVAGTWADQPS